MEMSAAILLEESITGDDRVCSEHAMRQTAYSRHAALKCLAVRFKNPVQTFVSIVALLVTSQNVAAVRPRPTIRASN